jgi:hypothetical protein
MKIKIAVIALALCGQAQAYSSVINNDNPSDVFGNVMRVGSTTKIYNSITGSDIYVHPPSPSANIPSLGFDVSTGDMVEVRTDIFGNTHIRKW